MANYESFIRPNQSINPFIETTVDIDSILIIIIIITWYYWWNIIIANY